MVRARARAIRDALSPAEWARVGAMGAATAALYAVGLALLLVAAPHHYRVSRTEVFGVGTGVLALTLGMRHAFDADHISAIDSTTRQLMSAGKRPLSVGFFFSLGHSSVVLVLTVLLNLGIRALDAQVQSSGSRLHQIASVVGTGVSGLFLYLIAALNLAVLISIVRLFAGLRRGRYDDAELEEQLRRRGLMSRVLGPLARRVDAPWKMYPVGMLFGLGFDTATEVALLVVSGSAVASGLPAYAILSLPFLFAAGMSTFDTLDGCFMSVAYGWAFARPIRKIYYNLTVTGLSVVVAVFIGTVELLQLLSSEAHWQGSLWRLLFRFNLNTAGFVVVGLFVATWAVALAIWRFGRIEERVEAAASRD